MRSEANVEARMEPSGGSIIIGLAHRLRYHGAGEPAVAFRWRGTRFEAYRLLR